MKFADLESKYESFSYPLLCVKIDGTEIDNDKIVISNAEIVLTAGYESSVCLFDAQGRGDAYSKGALTLDSAIQSAFRLGAKIEVSIGYVKKSKCTVVFNGYITNIELILEGGNILHHIEAMDVKVFMMNSCHSETLTDIKKYSEAAANILNDYSSLYDSKQIEATDELSVPIELYHQSDYEFIVSLAKRVNYLFYVLCGKIYFIPYSKCSKASLTLDNGRHLFRFQRSLSLHGQLSGVVVRAANALDPTAPFEATVTTPNSVGGGSKTAADTCRLINTRMQRTIIDSMVTSAALAKTRATAELTRASLDFVTGEIETIGVPELKPATLLSVEGMGTAVNSSYFLTEVTHRLDQGNYHTICRFCANKA